MNPNDPRPLVERLREWLADDSPSLTLATTLIREAALAAVEPAPMGTREQIAEAAVLGNSDFLEALIASDGVEIPHFGYFIADRILAPSAAGGVTGATECQHLAAAPEGSPVASEEA